jgi:hypothetical protein
MVPKTGEGFALESPTGGRRLIVKRKLASDLRYRVTAGDGLGQAESIHGRRGLRRGESDRGGRRSVTGRSVKGKDFPKKGKFFPP